MKDQEELKPCPFCGEKQRFIQKGVVYAWIMCGGCYASGPDRETLELAIKAWNERAEVKP